MGEEEEGCENCRTWEEEIYWTHFKTLHFCQILPKDFHHQLVIPKKFAENMWTRLPKTLSLRGPSGATWSVELKPDGDDLCFVDGWGEFVKSCSLEENDLLVFEYSGNSLFDVLIFGAKNFCEKESLYFIKKCGHAEPSIGNHLKRDGKDVVEEETHGGSQSVPSKRSRKYGGKEIVVMGETYSGVRYSVSTPKNSHPPTDDHDGGAPISTVQPCLSRKPDYSAVEENLSDGNDGLCIHTPTPIQSFPHEDNGSTAKATPQDPAEAGGEQRNQRAFSSSIKSKVPSVMYSNKKYEVFASNRRAIAQDEKAKVLKMAEQELTDGSFLVIMPPTAVYKRFFMSIPVDGIPKNLSHQSQVILRMGKKTWLTRFYTGRGRTGGLSSGWKKFALDNCLEEFDVCLFKPAGRDIMGIHIMDVSIFRVVPEAVPVTPVVNF